MLVPMKVEPKVYLSNERTHLHWAKFGATIGLAGVGIAKIIPTGNSQKEKITGYAFLCSFLNLINFFGFNLI